jgi:hypothetical protein
MCPFRPDVFPLQIFVARSGRTVFVFPVIPNIMPFLPRIVRGQPLIAPVSHEPYPTHRIALIIWREMAVARLVDSRGVVRVLVDVSGKSRACIMQVEDDS